MHRVSCYEEQYSIEYSIHSKVIAAEFFMVVEKKIVGQIWALILM